MGSTEGTLRCEPQEEEIEVDWSNLHSDLLQAIAKKLHDIADFIYFRSVCKKWRSATSISDLPPQIPWLLEQRDRSSENLRFYSLFSDKIRTIKCPSAHGKSFYSGPSHGYLYSRNFYSKDRIGNDYMALLNPLTKHEVAIPFRKSFRASLASMGPDPIGNDYMAFLDDASSQIMAFYRPCHREWHYAERPPCNSVIGHACLKGMYYRNETGTGATAVFDISRGSSCSIPPPETHDRSDHVYFVESAGKILRIAKKAASNVFFHIYELDFKQEKDSGRWVKTSSIGDHMIFLGWRNAVSITADGLRGNSIYFIANPNHCEGVVYKYNIEDGRIEGIPCPFNNSSTWLVPSVVGSLPDGE